MRTLAAPATLETEIKRSRFIVHAARVDSMSETLAFYESVADPSATHNCWAWRLDHVYRFNDDGEPASTAGRPILSAIEGKGLDHVMVIVTRHFGGIKLGVGGLVRAYGGSASRCLDQADILEIQERTECSLRAAFGWTGQVYAALEACGAEKLKENYTDGGIELRICVDKDRIDELEMVLKETTRGEATLRAST